ncbi:MAG: hypothetical protein ACHQ1H_09105 [Nitrososphaerales archaeon]
MKLYSQHGWGKGEKINRGLADDVVKGVIFSPHDEAPSDIKSYIKELSRRKHEPDLLFDPQLYVSLIRGANEGKLPQYDYYRQNLGLRDFAALRSVQQFVRECIDFQRDLHLTHILSPTICAESFTDRSAQVALTLAQEAVEYWGGISSDKRPLLISFLFSEIALTSSEQVSEFLDTISLLEADGFYLVVDRNTPGYSQDFQPTRLAQMMRMIHSLKRSRFEVVCGYSDFVSLLGSAVNADAGATGWSQKLKRFNRARFQPSAGGRRPRDRYSSSKLINSIYLTELDACQEVQRLRVVKSDTIYDRCFDGISYPSGVSWSSEDSALHHWASITQLLDSVTGSSIRDRLNQTSQLIVAAQTLYRSLSKLGVRFEPPNGPTHLESWAEAIATLLGEMRT